MFMCKLGDLERILEVFLSLLYHISARREDVKSNVISLWLVVVVIAERITIHPVGSNTIPSS